MPNTRVIKHAVLQGYIVSIPSNTISKTQFKFQAHQVDELSQLDKNNHLSNLALFIDDVYQSAIEVVEDINANYFNHIYRSDYRI